MAKAEKQVEIGCTPEKFYGVITDFERYPEFLSALSAVRVLSRDGETYRIEQDVDIVKKFKFVLDLTGEPGKRLSWTLVESGLLKKNDGAWILEPAADGRTRATYRLEVEAGRLVPKALVNKLIDHDMERMLAAFKRRAEALET